MKKCIIRLSGDPLPRGAGECKMKKILIIRFSSIGDIVLTTPVIRCLKHQVEDAEIHYLTKKQYLPILQANPYLHKIWLYEDHLRELIPQLKDQGFDFIVDLHKNHRSRFVKFKLGVPNVSFPKVNLQKWLMVNFKVDRLPRVHLVDRYFRAVDQLQIRNDHQGLDYFIPEGEEFPLSELPVAFPRDFIAVAIGSRHATKMVPVELVIEIGRKINKPLILLGGKEDRERGDRIATGLEPICYNACGLISLNQSASLVRQSERVLTNDTGLMHIAAAFRKPVVSVWGNTIPEFGMYPYFPTGHENDSFIAEVRGLSCRPCSKLGFKKCPKKHFKCMTGLNVDEIVAHL